MHSAEPFDRHSVNDPSQPVPTDEAWRAEVASRVNRYRASRQSTAGEEDGLALDFGPATGEPRSDGGKLGPANLMSAGLGARILDAASRGSAPGKPAHNVFDTHYYRRLNAQSLSAMTMGATAAAAQQELEAEDEAENGAAMPNASEGGPREWEAALLAIDLELHPVADGDAGLEPYRIPDAEPGLPCATLFEAAVTPPGAVQVAAPAFSSQGNLIVFPRPLLEPPLLPQPSRDELAEPVNRRPRILEVPEDIMPAVQGSLFPEIRLDADEPEVCTSRGPEIEVPLPVAPVSARLMASLADGVVVMAAGALFAAIACRALPEVPRTKPFWMALGGVTMLLWAVYQHLFLLYAGRTVGMSLRGLHLSTFDGRTPEWSERLRRARFIFISFASVALGFLWALVDEDTLCWHDRVSQTFPTPD